MKYESHLDKFLAIFIFLVVMSVYTFKAQNEFTQGLITGSMLSISVLLGVRNGTGGSSGKDGKAV